MIKIKYVIGGRSLNFVIQLSNPKKFYSQMVSKHLIKRSESGEEIVNWDYNL